jgi:16S rRNA processing protein RimM
VLVARTLKAYGLLGEIKVKPESFDLDRHEQLEHVLFCKNPIEKNTGTKTKLTVVSSRLHQEYWYLQFDGYTTPESIKPLSGGYLYIPEEERLELPEDMIYTTDMVGYSVLDVSSGAPARLGVLKEVQEYPTQEILVVEPETENREGHQEILIPWIDVFVKEINEEERTIHVNIEVLKGLYES